MDKKFIIAVVALALVATIGYALFGGSDQPDAEDGQKRISVVTTLFPLYDFTKAIGGERVEVSLLLPPGVESHAFEPKPSDIVRIDQADVFAYIGQAMEPWAVDIAASAAGKGVRIVDASVGIGMMAEEDHDEHEEEQKGEDGHSGMDPHIWLDFDNAAKIVDGLAAALSEKDPAHAEEYRTNAEVYRGKLAALDARYRSALASCQTRTIVYGGHYAFGYLAHRYGLSYEAAQGFSPDAEPTAKDLALLVEQVKGENMKTVFYEELASPKIAETIASETGAKLLLLNAAHNIAKEDYTGGISFLSIMEENLTHLSEGLGCSR